VVEFFPHARNFVKEMQWHNCARPWWVYVETFIPAFIKLFITITLVDFDDMNRMSGYAALGDRPGTGRRGGGHTRRRGLTGGDSRARSYSAGFLKHLLIATEFLEKIGFWFLLYGASEQFFYDWHTLLRQSIYCNGPLGVLMRRSVGGRVSILPGGAAIALPIVEQSDGVGPGLAFGTEMPFGTFEVVFALTVKGPLGGINGVHLRLIAPGSFEGLDIRSEEISIQEDEIVDQVLQVKLHYPLVGGGQLAWELVGPAVPIGLESEKGDIVIGKLD